MEAGRDPFSFRKQVLGLDFCWGFGSAIPLSSERLTLSKEARGSCCGVYRCLIARLTFMAVSVLGGSCLFVAVLNHVGLCDSYSEFGERQREEHADMYPQLAGFSVCHSCRLIVI